MWKAEVTLVGLCFPWMVTAEEEYAENLGLVQTFIYLFFFSWVLFGIWLRSVYILLFVPVQTHFSRHNECWRRNVWPL